MAARKSKFWKERNCSTDCDRSNGKLISQLTHHSGLGEAKPTKFRRWSLPGKLFKKKWDCRVWPIEFGFLPDFNFFQITVSRSNSFDQTLAVPKNITN